MAEIIIYEFPRRVSLSLPFLKKQQMNTTVHPSTNGKSSRFGSRRRTRTTYNIKRNKWDVAMWEEQLIEQGHSLTFTHVHTPTFNSCTEFDIFHCCKVGAGWLLVTLMVGAGAGPLELLALSSINPPQTLYFLKRLAHMSFSWGSYSLITLSYSTCSWAQHICG